MEPGHLALRDEAPTVRSRTVARVPSTIHNRSASATGFRAGSSASTGRRQEVKQSRPYEGRPCSCGNLGSAARGVSRLRRHRKTSRHRRTSRRRSRILRRRPKNCCSASATACPCRGPLRWLSRSRRSPRPRDIPCFHPRFLTIVINMRRRAPLLEEHESLSSYASRIRPARSPCSGRGVRGWDRPGWECPCDPLTGPRP